MVNFEFLSIILMIFGILQIILFFKVWRMTNNVNKILRKMEFPYMHKMRYNIDENEFMFYYLMHSKGKDTALEYLTKMVWCTDNMQTMLSTNSKDTFNAEVESLKNQFGKYYNKLGLDFPTFEELFNNENITGRN